MTLEELFNELFITQETRKKICEVADERSEKEVSQYEDELYNAIDRVLKMIAVHLPNKKEWILYTPERRIGKTRALLKLANDYNTAIVAKECERERLQYMAKELGYAEQWIVSPPELLAGKSRRDRPKTIIKMETVKIADIRNLLSDCYIVGIEEV